VIFETMAVLSIFVFRRRFPDAERPYRCWGYPVVPALYVVLPAFILVNMFREQLAEARAGVGFIALGAGIYFLFGLGKRRPTAFVGVGEPSLGEKSPTSPPSAPEGIQRKDQVSG
jgi:amino acid transporter